MERLAAMMSFAKVVEAKGFSAAARELHTSKSLVSKQVSSLEAELGVRLINRTTRRLSVTEVGAAYYAHCARIAEEIAAAEETVTRLRATPRGTLRLSAPTIFSALHLAPALEGYLRRYPDVAIDLHSGDHAVDLAEEGFDLAIRIAVQPQPGLAARKLAPLHWATCASPAYLARCGIPRTPADLKRHNCLVVRERWPYRVGRREVSVAVSGNLHSNSSEVVHQMALAGMGVILFPTYVVGEDLRTGRLVAVLGEYTPFSDSWLYAVYLPHRYVLPKVRSFIDYLVEVFGAEPYWDRAPEPAAGAPASM